MIVVVAGIWLNERNEIFLGRRIGPAYAGCWEIPGGKQEPGEFTFDTVRREWDEELGLQVHAGHRLFKGLYVTDGGIPFEMRAHLLVSVSGVMECRVHDHTDWFSIGDILALPDSECTITLKDIAMAVSYWINRD